MDPIPPPLADTALSVKQSHHRLHLDFLPPILLMWCTPILSPILILSWVWRISAASPVLMSAYTTTCAQGWEWVGSFDFCTVTSLLADTTSTRNFHCGQLHRDGRRKIHWDKTHVKSQATYRHCV